MLSCVFPQQRILGGLGPATFFESGCADEIGADGFAKDAATAANVAQELLA